jgi:origin recognition complex subunit 4
LTSTFTVRQVSVYLVHHHSNHDADTITNFDPRTHWYHHQVSTATMDDSPRSSKRRKLDAPKRTASSPVTKTSTRKASGRLANRSVSNTNGDAEEEEEPTPARRGRSSKSAPKATPAKRAAVEDIDVYDDIEGALNVELTPRRPSRRSLQAASTGEGTDELQASTTTAKRGKGQPTKVVTVSASRSAFRNLIKGSKNGAEGEADVEDAQATEATEATTPAKRAKAARTPAKSARKPAAPRSSARRKKEASSVVEKEEEETDELQSGVNGTTPSMPRSTRKPVASTRKRAAAKEAGDEEVTAATPSKSSKRRKPAEEPTTVLESEDELGDGSPTSNGKGTASTRRRMNRTDNITNHDEEHLSDAEEQVNGHDEDEMEGDGNSVLGSVLDPTEPSPFNKPTSAQKEKLVPSLIYSNLTAGRELDLLKTIVMERITSKRPSPLVGLDEEYKSVHQLVEQTITAGEGNSMLVIGARGSGKTALVNKVLSEVSKENGGQYHVVRLNGFIHTDDKIALREIWRQLGKEMAIEEDGSGPGKNYADTLATLLALLSHPSEQTGELTDQVAKAVVFVMDEFDLFATHPRQTLLYNLFDIAQSRKAPIAVLGLTTRIDVTNSLEKRVKSRFSHRYVHLRLATTFTAFQEICKACLLVQAEQLSVEERGVLEGGTKSTPARKGKKTDVLAEWNTNISVRPFPLSLPTYLLLTNKNRNFSQTQPS